MTVVEYKTVLYIDDNQTNRQLVELLLKKIPCVQCVTEESPFQGLVLAQNLQPDLILLDINMPGMTGYDVLNSLRKNSETRNIPVIAVTANTTETECAKGLAAGFDHYLTKPLNAKVFLDVTREMLS